jgi:hypothetical protein
VTLASVTGTLDLWKTFEADWRAVLKKHNAEYLHTTDLVAGDKPYSNREGWSDIKRTAFISDCVKLIDECVVIQRPDKKRRGLVPYAVTVYLEDYIRARDDNSELPHDLTEIMSVQVVDRCLDLGRRMGVDFFHLFFDQNEPYMGHVMDRKRSPKARRAFPLLEKIIQLGEIDTKRFPGGQMADVFAWCASHRDVLPHPPWQDVILAHERVFDERYRYAQLVKVNPGVSDRVRGWKLPRRKRTR